jgi:uncharacterized membrane protein
MDSEWVSMRVTRWLHVEDSIGWVGCAFWSLRAHENCYQS